MQLKTSTATTKKGYHDVIGIQSMNGQSELRVNQINVCYVDQAVCNPPIKNI